MHLITPLILLLLVAGQPPSPSARSRFDSGIPDEPPGVHEAAIPEEEVMELIRADGRLSAIIKELIAKEVKRQKPAACPCSCHAIPGWQTNPTPGGPFLPYKYPKPRDYQHGDVVIPSGD